MHWVSKECPQIFPVLIAFNWIMGQRAGKTSFTFIPLSGITHYPSKLWWQIKSESKDKETWPHLSLVNGGVFRHCYLTNAGNRECRKAIAKQGIPANSSSPKSYSKDTSKWYQFKNTPTCLFGYLKFNWNAVFQRMSHNNALTRNIISWKIVDIDF